MLSENELNTLAKDYISLASYYDNIDTSEFKKSGTAVIAGRTCQIYEGSYSYASTSYNEKIYIDTKTSACLKISTEFETGGEKSGVEFEALIFDIK